MYWKKRRPDQMRTVTLSNREWRIIEYILSDAQEELIKRRDFLKNVDKIMKRNSIDAKNCSKDVENITEIMEKLNA